MSKNDIYVFGLNCTTESSQTDGKIFGDEAWRDSVDRATGAVEGLASSQVFNTALRQSTFMARVLGGIISNRYGIDVGTGHADSLDSVADALSSLFNSTGATVFLNDSEVTTSKIKDASVITSKIADANSAATGVVGEKLGSILLGGSYNLTANGLTLSISQGTADKDNVFGRLKFSLTCPTVLKSDTLKHSLVSTSDTAKHYLLGTTTAEDSYTEGAVHSNIYAQMYEEKSILYSPSFLTTGGTPLAGETGYVQASFFNATSDMRLKENIEFYNTSALDIITSTPVCTYNFIGRESEGRHIGIMAQDIDRHEPLIITKNTEGYLGLKEDKLIYILWKAVQEQQKMIENLLSR